MEEEEKRLHRRSSLLLGLFALCLMCFCMILYDAQVVHREDYYARSASQVTTTEGVESSRGIITDTNGKMLVSNREIYTVTLDLSLIPEVEGQDRGVTVSRAILRLLELCEALDVTWTDTLPLTAKAPYVYTTASAGGTVRSWFSDYLAEQEWSEKQLTEEDPYPRMTGELREELGAENDVLTPALLLELMREDFGVDPQLTDQEARLVVGVLYELRLRSSGITYSAYTFAEDVPVELISLVNDGGFDGVVVGSQSVRQYNTTHAAQLLGQVGAFSSQEERERFNAAYNAAKEAGEETAGLPYYAADDTVGKSGVELAFESYLRGIDGERLITTNEEGKITGELYSVEPQPGGTVALTIDIDFQAAVEETLAATVSAMTEEDGDAARGAAAVVLSVEDSSVLAPGLLPHLRPRRLLQRLQRHPQRRRQAPAEPGHRLRLRPRLHLQALHRRGGPGDRGRDPDGKGELPGAVVLPRHHRLHQLRRLPRQPRPAESHPGPGGVLQLLLPVERCVPGHRCPGPVRRRLWPGAAHRHRAGGGHRRAGGAGALQRRQPDVVRRQHSPGGHRPVGPPLHPPPAGQLHRHPGPGRRPLRRSPAQVRHRLRRQRHPPRA